MTAASKRVPGGLPPSLPLNESERCIVSIFPYCLFVPDRSCQAYPETPFLLPGCPFSFCIKSTRLRLQTRTFSLAFRLLPCFHESTQSPTCKSSKAALLILETTDGTFTRSSRLNHFQPIQSARLSEREMTRGFVRKVAFYRRRRNAIIFRGVHKLRGLTGESDARYLKVMYRYLIRTDARTFHRTFAEVTGAN